jgi:adenosylcobinamide-GDP ribazoletransferase
MRSLILALQFMTRLPLPNVRADARDFAAAIGWFPATGAVVGGAVALATGLGAWVDPWLGALAGVVAWVGITGALHLDGLGDMADAGAAHKDPARITAVLADRILAALAWWPLRCN